MRLPPLPNPGAEPSQQLLARNCVPLRQAARGWLSLPTLPCALPSFSRWMPRVGGVALLGVAALTLPFPMQHLAQFEALNRELGKLCGNPPRQAQTVCRLHARLVSNL